ncbi:MAG TPA: DNA polymerase ligase N-terminal domain-containing protein [Patescibacteria group bacterium]|jgi:hypothetical protein|nr:DNA polymerase ligase N-terminal domain-containing protein [Patescibacteria group bacterium]
MQRPSLPFLIVLFVAGALVHKGLAKKGPFKSANHSLVPLKPTKNTLSFRKSPEETPNNDQPSFSIHKIVNSTIYYELYIQKNNILETWKIFKGPSCNPLHQRKAIKKADAPLDHLLFEGTTSLKEKTYKEGVLVWDYGTYTLQKGSTTNHYVLLFHGKRLQGLYTLEKRNHDWTLTKQEDTFADMHKNMTRFFTHSALSGLTLTQILHGLKPKIGDKDEQNSSYWSS